MPVRSKTFDGFEVVESLKFSLVRLTPLESVSTEYVGRLGVWSEVQGTAGGQLTQILS